MYDKRTRKHFSMALIAYLSFAMLALMALPAYAQSSSALAGAGDNMLSLSGVSIYPSPVIAGGNVTISFRLFNSYSEALSDVNLGLTTTSQIFNVSPSNTYMLSSIGSGVYGGLGYNVFTYTFHLPSTLISGLYTIDVIANYRVSVGTPGTEVPGESIMPITFYVHGKPNLQLNILPTSQVSPGNTMQYQLSVSNSGGGTARNITVKLLGSNTVTPFGNDVFSLGNIAPGAQAQMAGGMAISESAKAGSNNITAQVSYSTSIGSVSYNTTIPVSIYIGQPDIAISATGSTPQELYAGGNATLALEIQNVGDGYARNLTVNISGSSNLNIGSSARSFFIGALAPGQSVAESVFVSANSTYSNNAALYASVHYLHADYTNATSVSIPVSISIAPSAIFSISNVSDSIYPGAAYSAVTFNITNIGNIAAKQVVLSLQSIYPISPIAGNAYLKELAPGQSTSATFYVSVDTTGKPGEYPVTLYEQWKQPNAANSMQFTGSDSYYATVYSSNSGSSSGSSAIYETLLAVVVIIILVLLYKRIAKSKPKNTKTKK
ncbi:S-layer domain protein [mine drainage metagenome]|uniref:S-layer domain protein n=1 Tax=mine drainage metagenome TaxID=410659 RepID=T0YDN5_9ZZZZ